MQTPASLTWFIAMDGARERTFCVQAHAPRLQKSFMRRFGGSVQMVERPFGVDGLGRTLSPRDRHNLMQGLRRNAIVLKGSLPTPTHLAPEAILAQVAQTHAIEADALIGERGKKTPAHVRARAHAAHELRARTDLGTQEIAALLGLKSHSSVLRLLEKPYTDVSQPL